MGSQRAGHDWMTKHTHPFWTGIHWNVNISHSPPPHYFPSWNSIWKSYTHRCHSHCLFFVDKDALLRGFYKCYFSCNESSAIQACLFSLLHVSVPWLMDLSPPRTDIQQQRLSWKTSFLFLVTQALLVPSFVHITYVPSISFWVLLIIRKVTFTQIIELFNSIEIIYFLQIMCFIWWRFISPFLFFHYNQLNCDLAI